MRQPSACACVRRRRAAPRLLIEDVVVHALQRVPVVHHAAADGTQHFPVRRDSVARRQPHGRRHHLAAPQQRQGALGLGARKTARHPAPARRTSSGSRSGRQYPALMVSLPLSSTSTLISAMADGWRRALRTHGAAGRAAALCRQMYRLATARRTSSRGIRPTAPSCARSCSFWLGAARCRPPLRGAAPFERLATRRTEPALRCRCPLPARRWRSAAASWKSCWRR